jgi:hypothetical protein
MSVARAWTRQLYGASGVALLVPGAVAVALVLLAVAGGFGQLGDLSQALAGPSAPASAAAPGVAATAARTGGAILPVATATAARPGVVAGVPGTGARGQAGGRHVNPGAGTGPVATTAPGSGSTGTGSTGTGTPPGGGGQPPVSSGHTLIDGVVSVGTSVTSQLPGAAGSVTTGLLQSVGNGVDSILPSNGVSSTVAGASSTVAGATSSVAGTVKTLVPGVQLP